jgi:hypothetical protein
MRTPMSEAAQLTRTSRRRRGQAGVTKLDLLTLEDIDGRSRARQVALRMRDQLVSDLGGDPSAAQSALAQRAGILHALLEDLEARWLMSGDMDLSAYTTASGEQRRLLTTLGLQRVTRDVATLDQYMAAKDAIG